MSWHLGLCHILPTRWLYMAQFHWAAGVFCDIDPHSYCVMIQWDRTNMYQCKPLLSSIYFVCTTCFPRIKDLWFYYYKLYINFKHYSLHICWISCRHILHSVMFRRHAVLRELSLLLKSRHCLFHKFSVNSVLSTKLLRDYSEMTDPWNKVYIYTVFYLKYLF